MIRSSCGARRASPRPPRAALPVLRIDAPRAIPNEPKVGATLRMPGYRGRIGIELRGQSSQRFPKKSYAIELRDARGEDRKAPLLGMPADGDWVLYAALQRQDADAQRRRLRTARAIGRYAPRTRFVELRLNGRYHGVYVLMEKLELGDERVPGRGAARVHVPVPGAVEGAVVPHAGQAAPDRLGGPRAQRPLARPRASAIAAPVRAAERALYGPGAGGATSTSARRSTSCCSTSCSRTRTGSTRAPTWRCADGRLHLGPVWDFDISMGNSDYGPSSRLEGWMLARRDWAERLYRDRRFTAPARRPLARAAARGLRRDVLAGRRGRAARAARRDRAQLPPLAGARPADLAQPGRARQPRRRDAVPARVAEAPDRAGSTATSAASDRLAQVSGGPCVGAFMPRTWGRGASA